MTSSAKNPHAQPAADATIGTGAAIADLTLSALTSIPVPIATFLNGVRRISTSLADYLFFKKIEAFFEEAHFTTKEKLKLFKDRFPNKKDQEKFCEQLLLYLSLANDLEKPKIMAKFFDAFLTGTISKDELDFFWHVLDKNLVSHLTSFCTKDEIMYNDMEGLVLLNFGFFEVENPDVLWDGTSHEILIKSKIGLQFSSIFLSEKNSTA